MTNISESIKSRLPQEAKFIDLRNDFNYMEYCCLLNKLKGRFGRAFWDYGFFIRAIYKDSRIRRSYKFWRLGNVLFMLLVPFRIYSIARVLYAKNSLFYKLRTKVFP